MSGVPDGPRRADEDDDPVKGPEAEVEPTIEGLAKSSSRADLSSTPAPCLAALLPAPLFAFFLFVRLGLDSFESPSTALCRLGEEEKPTVEYEMGAQQTLPGTMCFLHRRTTWSRFESISF